MTAGAVVFREGPTLGRAVRVGPRLTLVVEDPDGGTTTPRGFGVRAQGIEAGAGEFWTSYTHLWPHHGVASWGVVSELAVTTGPTVCFGSGTLVYSTFAPSDWGATQQGTFVRRIEGAGSVVGSGVTIQGFWMPCNTDLWCDQSNLGTAAGPGDVSTQTAAYTEYVAAENAERRLDMIVQAAFHEDFEFGMESAFAQELTQFLREYPSLGVEAIERRLWTLARKNLRAATVLAQVLGDDRDARTHEARFELLVKSLRGSVAGLRDSAALALYRIDDPRSQAEISRAVANEPNRHVRRMMSQLISRAPLAP